MGALNLVALLGAVLCLLTAPAFGEQPPPEVHTPFISDLKVAPAIDEAMVGTKADNAAGRLAAREVMVQYVEAMSAASRSQPNRMQRRAALYIKEYLAARPSDRAGATPAQVRALVTNLDFRKFVYSKLIDPEFQSAYWASPAGQQVMQAAANTPVQLPEPEPEQEPDQAGPKARRNDPKAVFGFVMDAPLEGLPGCGLMELEGTTRTCVFTGMLVMSLAKNIIEGISGNRNAPAGMQRFAVHLAKDRCPSWIDHCHVVLTLGRGRLLKVEAATSSVSDQDVIEAKLSQRFGRHSIAGYSHCISSPNKANNRKWSANGLHVKYWPYGPGKCGNGYVAVESSAFRQAASKIEENDPSI